ncbi:hypothetical protein J19TS2_29590 [Cohnella xylanilytica]|uniref:alpha/beta hydrolase n=1 Tax=Cohnella xylanilytica TaxID=557555 RepID=UPI001B085749|nr:alpha/beta fold hydrolase [Cohnella xylanilytica]GIO13404.1 hypothetical protein J19TS2_29590 [Cohnella xylanilytica]
MSATTLSPYPLDSMPVPALPGGALGLPIEEARRRGRWIVLALTSVVCLAVFVVIAFYALVCWALVHPPVGKLQSNPMEARGLAYKDVTFLSADGRSEVNGWWIPAPAPDGPAPEGTATLAAALPKTASDPAAASATVPVSDNVAAASTASTAAMASQPASDDSAAAASNLFSGRTVILSHGYGTNREESWVPMYDIAALLHGLDYNVLMFDYGYADSRNRAPATGGVYESGQLLGALKFAREQGSREVVVWGFSMGAGTALQAALRTDLIDGMILDSAFIPDADSIYSNIRRYASLPKRLSLELIRAIVPMFAGTRLEQIPSAEAQSTAFAFPVLVIHGSADDKAPASISENVAAAQTNPLSELWSVPDAMHEMIFRTHPEEYVRRTTGFLQAIRENVEARQDASSTITA